MYDFYVKAPNGEIKTRKQKNLYQFVSDERKKKEKLINDCVRVGQKLRINNFRNFLDFGMSTKVLTF